MLKIYTDGSYSSSRNQGGWAFIIIKNDKILYKNCGGVKNTTNNRMEIMAVLKALKLIEKSNYKKAIIYTDSMYVIGTLTKNWERNHNLDLWSEFDNYDLSKIQFEHVKGHSTNEFNNKCDEMAVQCSKLNIL